MSEEREERVRVRLSVKPELHDRLLSASDVLGLDRTAMATLCFALGLRFLEMSVIKPMSAGIEAAMEQRVDAEMAGVARDAELPARRR
jgi:hypothetical protein